MSDDRPVSKRAAAQRRIAEKRLAEKRVEEAAQRRRRTVIGGSVAGVLVVVALLVVIVIQVQRTSTSAEAVAPAGVGDDGQSFLVGPADAPVTVEVYEDFVCPACGQFEALTGPTLAALAEEGAVQVRYRPIALLDQYSTDKYSTRSLNAAAVVADAAGVEGFLQFHEALFAQQPREGGPGLSDDTLIELAGEAGATGADVADAIRDLRFGDWVEQVTDAASKAGVNSTPTVLVDGEQLADRSPQGLSAAVAAAG